MATITLSTDELDALTAERDAIRAELAAALAERETLVGLLRTVTVERDLLQEKLKAFLRKLFDAKSEVRGTDQKDLFFNEAEVLAPVGTPVAEEAPAEIEIPAHTRKKRGRKPLDPRSYATNCPSRNASVPTTGRHWSRSVSKSVSSCPTLLRRSRGGNSEDCP